MKNVFRLFEKKTRKNTNAKYKMKSDNTKYDGIIKKKIKKNDEKKAKKITTTTLINHPP